MIFRALLQLAVKNDVRHQETAHSPVDLEANRTPVDALEAFLLNLPLSVRLVSIQQANLDHIHLLVLLHLLHMDLSFVRRDL